ncbi:PR domain zinc finger protein 12 [Mactra antiquata]
MLASFRSKCIPKCASKVIFNVNGVILGFINGGTHTDHWIMHVQCARSEREQNLEIIQLGTKLFYRAFRDIEIGEELFVWYGKDYNLYMGIPCWNKSKNERLVPEEDQVEETRKEIVVKGRWQCVLCQRGFNSRSNLRSHMRIHTLEKPFSCKYCSRKFSQSSTLRNHVRLHTGEKPYKCIRCNSCYSQLAGLRAHQRSSTHKPGLH